MRTKARIKKIEASIPPDLWKREVVSLLKNGTLTIEQIADELGQELTAEIEQLLNREIAEHE
ncbi:MAG: hypothetical protein H6641_15675 [Caldilineaceae bacterium]|nr:hypothetical protein [Caldilineaceae bacterium]